MARHTNQLAAPQFQAIFELMGYQPFVTTRDLNASLPHELQRQRLGLFEFSGFDTSLPARLSGWIRVTLVVNIMVQAPSIHLCRLLDRDLNIRCDKIGRLLDLEAAFKVARLFHILIGVSDEPVDVFRLFALA